MKTFLLSVELRGIKNLDYPVRVDFYRRKSLRGFNPEGDRVRVLYGANGVGKTAFITGVWLLKYLLGGNSLDQLGDVYFDYILNKKKPEFSCSVEYLSAEDKKTNSKMLGHYRYEIALRKSSFGYRLAKESFLRVNEINGASEYKTIFKTDNGRLIEFDQRQPDDLRTYMENYTSNLLSFQSFVAFFPLLSKQLSSLKKLNKKGKRSYDDFLSLAVLSSRLRVRLDNGDKHAELFELNRNKLNSLGSLSPKKLSEFLQQTIQWDKNDSIYVKKKDLESFERYVEKQAKFIRHFKPDLRSITVDKQEAGEFYRCKENMNYDGYSIDLSLESTGIKKLAALYSYLQSAANGGIVFVDEMDANISGVYLKNLVEYMNEFGEGQLCFTAHSLDPMYALSKKSKSIYFLGEEKNVVPWIKNAHYQPYKLYPEGMIPGIPFNMEPFDFVEAFAN